MPSASICAEAARKRARISAGAGAQTEHERGSVPLPPHGLKALVAVDLKLGKFEPGYAGKMNAKLNLLNEKDHAPDDAPSIRITTCAEVDKLEVEFAMKGNTNPIDGPSTSCRAHCRRGCEGSWRRRSSWRTQCARRCPARPMFCRAIEPRTSAMETLRLSRSIWPVSKPHCVAHTGGLPSS